MYRYNPYNQRRHNPYRQNLFGGLKAKAAGFKDSVGRKVSSRVREGEACAREIEEAIVEAVDTLDGENKLMQRMLTETASLNTDPHPGALFEGYGEAAEARGALNALFSLPSPISAELTARVEKTDARTVELMAQFQEIVDNTDDSHLFEDKEPKRRSRRNPWMY